MLPMVPWNSGFRSKLLPAGYRPSGLPPLRWSRTMTKKTVTPAAAESRTGFRLMREKKKQAKTAK